MTQPTIPVPLRHRPVWNRDRRYAALMVLPSVLVILSVIIYPLGYAVTMSTRGSRQGAMTYVGLKNYVTLLANPDFQLAAWRTLYFTVAAVALVTLVSLGIALLINEALPGSTLLKVSLLLPYALPGSLSAVIWRWIYDPNFGILNAMLKGVGLTREYVSFTADGNLAMWAIILAHVWKYVPYSAFLFVAGLASIPRNLYEAALVDNASGWTTFRRITLPLLMPVMQLVLIVQTVFAILYHFGLVFVLTGGGPGNATTTLPWYVYMETFTFMNFGRGSAAAVILAVIMLIFVYLYLGALQPKRGNAHA